MLEKLKNLGGFYVLIGLYSPILWFASSTSKITYGSFNFLKLPFFLKIVFLLLLVLSFLGQWVLFELDSLASKSK